MILDGSFEKTIDFSRDFLHQQIPGASFFEMTLNKPMGFHSKGDL